MPQRHYASLGEWGDDVGCVARTDQQLFVTCDLGQDSERGKYIHCKSMVRTYRRGNTRRFVKATTKINHDMIIKYFHLVCTQDWTKLLKNKKNLAILANNSRMLYKQDTAVHDLYNFFPLSTSRKHPIVDNKKIVQECVIGYQFKGNAWTSHFFLHVPM